MKANKTGIDRARDAINEAADRCFLVYWLAVPCFTLAIYLSIKLGGSEYYVLNQQRLAIARQEAIVQANNEVIKAWRKPNA